MSPQLLAHEHAGPIPFGSDGADTVVSWRGKPVPSDGDAATDPYGSAVGRESADQYPDPPAMGLVPGNLASWAKLWRRRRTYGTQTRQAEAGVPPYSGFYELLLTTANDLTASSDVGGAAHGEGPRAEFEQLAAEWKQETAHLSSVSVIAQHPAYQQIIGMGKEAIPLILQDLRETRAQWFWALRSIARESPVNPEDRGDVDAMTDAWLEWGRRSQHIT